jgi:hypothetical protein
MHELSLIDNTFRKDRTNAFHLSVQADLHGFSFCIFDHQQKKHVVFRKYFLQTHRLIENFIRQLEELLKTDDLLLLPYASSVFLFLSQKSTLIPDNYFDQRVLKSYLEFNHEMDVLDEIHYNYIPSVDAYNVFALHTYIASAINGHFKGVRFFHQAMPFIEKVSEYSDYRQKQIMAVNVNHHFFDVAVSSSGRLKLYNTFQYKGPTDLLYFILYICNQFEIDPLHLELVLSGELSDMMPYRDAIQEYVPGVQTVKTAENNLAEGLAKVKEPNYFTLFNLVHCE